MKVRFFFIWLKRKADSVCCPHLKIKDNPSHHEFITRYDSVKKSCKKIKYNLCSVNKMFDVYDMVILSINTLYFFYCQQNVRTFNSSSLFRKVCHWFAVPADLKDTTRSRNAKHQQLSWITLSSSDSHTCQHIMQPSTSFKDQAPW